MLQLPRCGGDMQLLGKVSGEVMDAHKKVLLLALLDMQYGTLGCACHLIARACAQAQAPAALCLSSSWQPVSPEKDAAAVLMLLESLTLQMVLAGGVLYLRQLQ